SSLSAVALHRDLHSFPTRRSSDLLSARYPPFDARSWGKRWKLISWGIYNHNTTWLLCPGCRGCSKALDATTLCRACTVMCNRGDVLDGPDFQASSLQ